MARWFWIPAAPLVDYIENAGGIYAFIGSPDVVREEGTAEEVTAFFTAESRYKRAVKNGRIDLFVADAFCIDTLRIHPCRVYPDWFDYSPDIDNLAALEPEFMRAAA